MRYEALDGTSIKTTCAAHQTFRDVEVILMIAADAGNELEL